MVHELETLIVEGILVLRAADIMDRGWFGIDGPIECLRLAYIVRFWRTTIFVVFEIVKNGFDVARTGRVCGFKTATV